MSDLVTIAVAVLTFAALVAGCAIWQSYHAAVTRVDSERLARHVRRAADGGRFIGGTDKPGDN
jgi:cytochrome b subunit of formate dehydrogenase